MVVLHAGNGESRGDTDGCRNGGGVGGLVGVVTMWWWWWWFRWCVFLVCDMCVR